MNSTSILSFLIQMLKNKLYFAMIFLLHISPNVASDFYSKFYQKDYKVEAQRLELIDYNKSVFNIFEIKNFKYNRTQPAANITVNSKMNMTTELEAAVQLYKFLSNEYRKLHGTNFQVNSCRSYIANLGGIQELALKTGNFTPCQMIQGTTYKLWNAYPDESRFPPFFPSGEFKIEIHLLCIDEIIAEIAGYIRIYRPIPIPKKK